MTGAIDHIIEKKRLFHTYTGGDFADAGVLIPFSIYEDKYLKTIRVGFRLP